MVADPLPIEETKHRQPAILSAPDAIKKLTAAQAESHRAAGLLPQNVIFCAFGPVGKSLVRLSETQKSIRVAGTGVVGVKTVSQRSVHALDGLFVRVPTNSQDLVVIGVNNVFVVRPRPFRV